MPRFVDLHAVPRSPVRTAGWALVLASAAGLLGCDNSKTDIAFVGESSVSSFGTTTEDNLVLLGSLTINYEGQLLEFTRADLKNIEVLDYSSSALPFETAILGVAQPEGTMPETAPTNDTRALFVEDFAINTSLDNPSVSAGMTFQFVDAAGDPTTIRNNRGPDLMVLELSPSPFSPLPGGFFAMGGDPFTIRGTGPDVTKTASFMAEDYVQLGPNGLAAGISLFSNVAPMMPADPIASLAGLESTPLEFLELTDLNVYAILIDLSDLGYEQGALVSEMTILSLGAESGVDLALVVGLN